MWRQTKRNEKSSRRKRKAAFKNSARQKRKGGKQHLPKEGKGETAPSKGWMRKAAPPTRGASTAAQPLPRCPAPFAPPACPPPSCPAVPSPSPAHALRLPCACPLLSCPLLHRSHPASSLPLPPCSTQNITSHLCHVSTLCSKNLNKKEKKNMVTQRKKDKIEKTQTWKIEKCLWFITSYHNFSQVITSKVP